MNPIITIYLLLLPFTIVAQPNFVKGSITTLNGETIEGKIDYREWVQTPQFIRFRPFDSPDVITTYTVNDLLRFKINDNQEEYHRAIVGINKEPLKKYESIENFNPVIPLEVDTVFLLVLVKGRINLYSLHDENEQLHYFIQKGIGRIEELIYQAIEVKENVNAINQMNLDLVGITSYFYRTLFLEDYKKQLLEAMPDCPGITQDINRALYLYNIQKIVQKYNKCVDALTYVKSKNKAKSYFYSFIGGAQPFFTFKDNNITTDLSLSGSLAPSFGIGFDIGIIRSLNKLSLGVEANYVAASGTTTTRAIPFDNQWVKNNYTFDIRGVRFNALLKYVVYNGKIRPYLKAGIGVSSYSKANLRNTTSFDGQSFFINRFNNDLLNSELHGIIGVGLKINNFFLESRFESGNDLNRTTGENLVIRRLSVLIGYELPLNQ